MSLIVAEGLCKSWSDKDVLKNVQLTLAPQERVGLVGPNGEGKTTLIRILAGLEEASSGILQRKIGLRAGYLPQDPPALEGSTLRQAMFDVFARLHQIERELAELAHQMGQNCDDPRLLARYGQLQHEFEEGGGYDYTRRIELVLEGLNFPRDLWDRPLSVLSGGQRTRAFLARILLESPDVLLLDEPTNHLDLEAVEWLETWLRDFPGSLVLVSHDRYFLDKATTKTWEVCFATLETYPGNYSRYLQQRQERFTERMRRWEAQQEYIHETEDFIRRFGAGQRAKEARGRQTRLDRFIRTEAIQRPRQHERITVRLKAGQRTGDIVLRLSDLRVGYEARHPLLEIEHLEILRGQRIAIVGPNGCGKTTLLKTLLGHCRPLGGKIHPGAGVQYGYLSQTHAELAPQMTAVESVRQIDSSLTDERARSLLGSLLLGSEHASKRIVELSGGQRSRVVLARLVLQKAPVLVLDEPTNHLDIPSQEVLQDVLADFDGTVIFVSHDRYLIQALATHIWAIQDGRLTTLGGNWDRYLQWRQEQMGVTAEASDAARQESARAKQERKEDFEERRRRANELQRLHRRLQEVEQAIHELESRLKGLNEQIGQAGEAGDVEQVTALGEDYAACDARLRTLFAEWEKLSVEVEGSE